MCTNNLHHGGPTKKTKPLCVRRLQTDVEALERSLEAARSQIIYLQFALFDAAMAVKDLRRESYHTKKDIVRDLRKAYRHSLNVANSIK